ncbi:MAG: ATP-dependent DNA helicase [Rhodoferax sp.]|nr:ATP-dependent DNA helicase [Rhodoferax sp.]
MSKLAEQVLLALSPAGALAQAVPEFRSRSGQREMAEAVSEALEQGGPLVVEAGTGIGKTYAYLLPTLLSGKRVLLSTATKALQDQLFGRDIPQLLRALAVPARVALLKGRASYLCQYRLGRVRQLGSMPEQSDLQMLAAIERWAVTTRSGDLSELPALDERSPWLPLVTSTRENCGASQCPDFASCHVYKARREAMAADVVVINHHLFFADLGVKESGVAELLPTVHAVVFDEAHQLNEIGIQFLGTQISTGQLLGWARDVVTAGLDLARGLGAWSELAMRLEGVMAEWQLLCRYAPDSASRVRWVGAAPDGVAQAAWVRAMQQVVAAASSLVEALAPVAGSAPALAQLHERGGLLVERLVYFGGEPPEWGVRWLEPGLRLRLHESPLTIAETLRTQIASSAGGEASQRAWIFTSATLGGDPDLAWFVAQQGLEGARVLQLPSPFDYAEQAAVYVPAVFPKPADPEHSGRVAMLVAQSSFALGGRTLVLTTSLRAMRHIGKTVRQLLPAGCLLDVLVQGDLSKKELLARFEGRHGTGGAGAVLIATGAFWEGVDLPGAVLQQVVIDKIPFAPPDDPWVEASCQRLEAQGRNAFQHFQVPMAAMALKQGAGRLIRRESDQGVLVICDVRLIQMSYGRKILAALPPFRRLSDETDYQQTLLQLTKVSTTGSEASSRP